MASPLKPSDLRGALGVDREVVERFIAYSYLPTAFPLRGFYAMLGYAVPSTIASPRVAALNAEAERMGEGK